MKKIFLLIVVVLLMSSSVFANDSLAVLTLQHAMDLALDKDTELEALQKLYQEKRVDLELYQKHFGKDFEVNVASDYSLWEEDGDKWDGLKGGSNDLTKLSLTKNFSPDDSLTLSQNLLEKDSNDDFELEGSSGSLTYNHYLLKDYDLEDDYKQGLMKKRRALLEAEKKVKESRDELKKAVIDKYYKVIELGEEIKVKEESLRKSQATLKIVRARVETGRVLELDKQEAKLQVEENELDLRQLNSEYRVALKDLARELKVDLSVQVRFADSELILEFNTLAEEAKKLACSNELEIDILSLKQKKEEDLIDKLEKDRDFDLKLLGGAVWEKDNGDYESDYRVAMKLDYSFNNYDKKKQKQDIKKSKIELTRLTKELEDIREDISFDVDYAFLKLEDYQVKMSVYKKAIANLEEKLRIADYKYKSGLISIDELLSQQVDLEEKRVDYINSLVNYNKQVYQIKILMGVE
ncbi:TolC family protein [Orenia metallireducens]|uniref:TolC family protein n=1 Tax=Orenia metallireducens TaxID=1413210 RepID=UPI000D056153|nr:TolC family protein [Orenia metallireducens]